MTSSTPALTAGSSSAGQPRAPALRDRADDPSRLPPRPGAALHTARGHVLDAAYARNPERFVRKPPSAGATDCRVDQQAEGGHCRSLISNASRLTGLDRLRLADSLFVVCPDLRGYGRSTLPADAPEHAQSSKRAMANDVVSLVHRLGHDRSPLSGTTAALSSVPHRDGSPGRDLAARDDGWPASHRAPRAAE